MTNEYTVVSETNYKKNTDTALISILENLRSNGKRITVYYGDTGTKKLWGGDKQSGYIGRSTGWVKIPLLVNNSRSLGGTSLIEDCILKLEYSNKKEGGILYDITK